MSSASKVGRTAKQLYTTDSKEESFQQMGQSGRLSLLQLTTLTAIENELARDGASLQRVRVLIACMKVLMEEELAGRELTPAKFATYTKMLDWLWSGDKQ